MPKNAERAAGVEIRCDDQNPGTFFSCQAFCRVARFLASREPRNRTDPNRRGLRKILNILLRQLNIGQLVNPCCRWYIDYQPSAVALIQKLQAADRATIRLSREHQNHVRGLRSIHYQQSACIGSERDKYRGQDNRKNPDASPSALIFHPKPGPPLGLPRLFSRGPC